MASEAIHRPVTHVPGAKALQAIRRLAAAHRAKDALREEADDAFSALIGRAFRA